MDDLDRALSDELKASTLWPGNELVLPYAQALKAIGIATDHQIAILGFEAFKVARAEIKGLLTVDYSGYDIPYKGDWHAYVAASNVEAERWIRQHAYGENHGYILTSASEKEFEQIQATKTKWAEGKPDSGTAVARFQEFLRRFRGDSNS